MDDTKSNDFIPSADLPLKPDAPVEVIGVRFRRAGKVYYFAPCGRQVKTDDSVIVETARGIEIGTVTVPNTTVQVRDVVLPLRNVMRIATEDDIRRGEENAEKEKAAFKICLEKIAAHGLEMNLTDAEYTFDRGKLLFYFTADGRVDFRELVKDLASVFKTRIELRQIGIRDEAKMLGGLGVCGRPFCCASFLSDFVQVSIRMAKEQNFSLNSAKVSGACGRLMCCLRYEHEVYEEEIRKTPAHGATVKTADGIGIVTESNPLAGTVRVRYPDKNDVPKLYNRDDVTVISSGKPQKGQKAGSSDSSGISDSADSSDDGDEAGDPGEVE